MNYRKWLRDYPGVITALVYINTQKGRSFTPTEAALSLVDTFDDGLVASDEEVIDLTFKRAVAL